MNESNASVFSSQPDLGAGSCASGDNQNQSGSQFPMEDDRLPGGMHWRPYFGVDTDVDRLLAHEAEIRNRIFSRMKEK